MKVAIEILSETSNSRDGFGMGPGGVLDRFRRSRNRSIGSDWMSGGDSCRGNAGAKKRRHGRSSYPCREASDANYFRPGGVLHNRNKYTIA